MAVFANWLQSGRRVGVAAGILAAGWLGIVVGAPPACAGQDTDTASQRSAVPLATTATVPPPAPGIADLLATVEQQIAEPSSSDDNVLDTFLSIIGRLPDASMADLQAVRDIPSRFAQRASAAEAAGQHEEAQRFLLWAGLLATPLDAATSQSDQVAHNTLEAGTAHEASRGQNAGTSGSGSAPSVAEPSLMVASPEPPGPPGTMHSDADARSDDADMRSRGSTLMPETGAAVPSAVVPGRIADLLATAEQQITDGRLFLPPNDSAADTFASIITLLPDASMTDLHTMHDLPSRFAQRARAAEAAGRHEEAQRFLLWAGFLATPPDAATSQSDQMVHNAPKADIVTPPSHGVLPRVEVVLRPMAPPHKAAGRAGSAREAESGRGGQTAGTGMRQPSPSGVPPAVRLSPVPSIPIKRAVARAADEHCRAIVLKVQLGEEPSNADRAYLRQGCQHG